MSPLSTHLKMCSGKCQHGKGDQESRDRAMLLLCEIQEEQLVMGLCEDSCTAGAPSGKLSFCYLVLKHIERTWSSVLSQTKCTLQTSESPTPGGEMTVLVKVLSQLPGSFQWGISLLTLMPLGPDSRPSSASTTTSAFVVSYISYFSHYSKYVPN